MTQNPAVSTTTGTATSTTTNQHHDQSQDTDHYRQMYREFRWEVPEYFNIAEVCSRRWAADPMHGAATAIHYEDSEGHCESLSYANLQVQANQLSQLLHTRGIRRGDVVACILPQRPQTAVTLMACLQMGAIIMPLSFLFGPEALEYRLQHSEASTLIVDQSGIDAYLQIRAACPALKTLIALDCQAEQALDWHKSLADMPPQFEAAVTLASDPAILIYTSGTTGAPKGALLPHSALIGNLPGFVA
jgi:acetyl-CoA synthetase